MTRGRTAAALIVVAVAAATVFAGSAGAPAAASTRAPAARRMLVVSLPMITWADLRVARLPNLSGLLEQSMIAGLSVRGVHRRTTLADGYVTVAAGARALGSGRAGDAANRTDGSILSPGFPEIVEHNDDLFFDAHPGALATALEKAGIDRAVIGNAGRVDVTTSTLGRQVANALATPDGVTPGGDVSDRLLASAGADEPFGIAIDSAAYLRAFRQAWTGRTVVLVEDSDLVRFDGAGGTDAVQLGLLERFDHLLGQMLESVDPSRDAVMVIGPTYPHGAPQLTIAALRAPGTRPGLAVSPYTRHTGFVSIVDVGPTILDTLRVDAPSSMEGRPMEFGRAGGNFADRRSFIVDANRAAVFRDVHVQAVTTAFLVAQLVLVVLAVGACLFPVRALRRLVELVALSVLGALPAMFLAGLLPFDRHGLGVYWVFLVAAGVVIGGGAWLVSDRRGLTPLMICLAVIVGVLVVDVVTGARLQFNTMFGYSPTIGGRFAGIGNLAYAQLASAALLLAALIVAWKTPANESRASGRSGAVLAIAVLAIALVVDGLPIWGADIGGVLSMVPAYVIVTVGLLGLRVRARTLLIAVGATACALGAATLVDLSRPEDHRSHLGRLVSSTRDDGWRSLTVVVQRKLSANIDALWPSQWTIISAIVLAFVVALVWRAPGGLPALLERIPSLRPALVGLVVLAVLGYALNDSGIPIPGVMVGIVTPVLVVILLRAGDEDKTGRVPQKIGETG